MREIHRVSGKYVGTHLIFDGLTEAQEYFDAQPQKNVNGQLMDTIPHWTNAKKLDWVTADDGCVLQILHIYEMDSKYSKAQSTHKVVMAVKTAIDTVSYVVYLEDSKKYKAGDKVIRYTMHCTKDKFDSKIRDSMSDKVLSLLGYQPKWKKLFVYYLAIYHDPEYALRAAYERKTINRKSTKILSNREIQNTLNTLMKDPVVLKEMENYMAIDNWRTNLKKKLGERNIDENRVVDEVVEGLDAVKKGTQTHKMFIEMTLNILRYANDEEVDTEGKKLSAPIKPVTADFEMLPEPPKALKSLVDDEVIDYVREKNVETFIKSCDISNETEEGVMHDD